VFVPSEYEAVAVLVIAVPAAVPASAAEPCPSAKAAAQNATAPELERRIADMCFVTVRII
jgi:hypothetical protein